MLWDIFCDIIDNHGDLGVTWRLSAALANRGESVRLWIQGDASALAWMAPKGHPRVKVLGWQECLTSPTGPPGDVLLEAFGCEPPLAWVQHCAEQSGRNEQPFPVWINLEYLSAEAYVERCHGLTSPVMSGPGKGQTKWFFYPGFTEKTGGLIHRLNHQAITTPTSPSTPTTISNETPHEDLRTNPREDSRTSPGRSLLSKVEASGTHISLFCYEPPALPVWLAFLQAGGMGHQTTLHIAPGRVAEAVHRAQAVSASIRAPSLRLDFFPNESQIEFDHRLARCDLNFVRGEDSLVSALFANKPFIWQIYPQSDGAHADKLQAFLDWLEAPPSLRQAHLWWNGLAPNEPTQVDLNAWFAPEERQKWAAAVTRACSLCGGQTDLVDQLLGFCSERTAAKLPKTS